MILGSVLLLAGSVALGFTFATRRLDILDRPRIAWGGPALLIMVLGFGMYVGGATLIWTAVGWIWGLVAVIAGFWILPSVFAGFFTRTYRRP